MRSCVRLAALLAVFIPTPLFAQSTGTVQGVVTDAQGGILPGVAMTVRNSATGIDRVIPTDTAGRYVAAGLPPGPYPIEAWNEKAGTQTASVTIGPKETKEISFTFKPAGGTATN